MSKRLDTAAKVLPTRQYTFNSRTSPLNYSDTTRNTIVCNLGKDAFKVPDNQECLLSVITAEIQYGLLPPTFDVVPTFSILGEGGSGVISTNQTFNGVNITNNYTLAQLITALNGKTYTHGANTLTLGVAQTSGAYTLNFSITGGTGSYIILMGSLNTPQLGINAVPGVTTPPSFLFPFTTPSAPLLQPKYFIVRSPDLQTMYNQAIAKIQNIPPQTGNYMFYQNYSDFDTRVLSPYIQMFQLQLCDEDGNPINLRGNDWSINVQFKFVPKQNLEFM